MSQKLSVRELAEFVCRSGDLYARAEGRRIDALDGIRAQEVLRERRKNKYTQYSSEVAFKHDFTLSKRGDDSVREGRRFVDYPEGVRARRVQGVRQVSSPAKPS